MPVSINHWKSHTRIRLIPTSVITVVQDGRNVCRISSSTFGQKWPTQQRGLCDSWATCCVLLTFDEFMFDGLHDASNSELTGA